MFAWGSASSSNARRNAAGRGGRPLAASLWLAFLLCPGIALARQPLPDSFSRWLNQEVVYLITDEERRAFLRLDSDEARQKFIEEFWEVRNPARGSGRNPVKEEHYRRLEYVNSHFGHGSNTPGWKTDMGRTYILFGEPVSRATFTGYSQIYPMELWFYRNATGNPGLPAFFYVLFFRPDDSPEYRYYRPFLDGPMKLVRGTQFRTNRDVYEFLKPLGGDLARAAFSLIPGTPIDLDEFQPDLASDMLVSKIQNYANDAWQVRRLREARQLRAQVTSWLLVPSERPLEGATMVFTDPQGEYWVDYAVLVDDPALGRQVEQGRLEVSVAYRLFAESGELAFEDSVKAAYPAYENSQFQPFLLGNRVPIAPGKYRLEVEIANRETASVWKFERLVEVGAKRLDQPLLARGFQVAAQPAGAMPFQYSGVQFVPVVGGRLGRGDVLRVLTPITATHSEPGDYELEFVIAHMRDREMRRVFRDQTSSAEFRHGKLLKAKTIPLDEFEPGDYRLIVHLRKPGHPQVLASATAPFRIGASDAGLKLHSTRGSVPLTVPAASYLRALACLAQKDTVRAAAYLRRAIDGGFSPSEARRLLHAIESRTMASTAPKVAP